MHRITTEERPGWRAQAKEFGFKFHSMYGEPYWDETAYYCFDLEQIEQHLEAPTEEIHQMCLQVVGQVVGDEALLERFQIPESYWDRILRSWQDREPSFYSRIDLAYDGTGPAKLYENNADTPTSLYEKGFWQWLWLEDKISIGELPSTTDQFNSLQEKLIGRFERLAADHPNETLHLSCCKDSEEDRGTVQYLEDCAKQAGILCKFVYIEDIGHGEGDFLTDFDNQIIERLFKLYPWEFMLREEYGPLLLKTNVSFLEPWWKAILSNKALLPPALEDVPRPSQPATGLVRGRNGDGRCRPVCEETNLLLSLPDTLSAIGGQGLGRDRVFFWSGWVATRWGVECF